MNSAGANFKFKTPRTTKVVLPTGEAALTFDPSFGARMTDKFSTAQKFVDNEVLRYCESLIPFQTGMLARSGKMGTVLGSGLVKYIAPYAAEQYYNTATSRSYDANRGAKWFERMKAAYKKDILKGAKKFM